MGAIASGFVAKLTPIYEGCDSVVQAWEQVLPPNLRSHCRMDGFRNGCLHIMVDGASYRYELQLCKAELLTELRRLCPGTGLRRIQISMARG